MNEYSDALKNFASALKGTFDLGAGAQAEDQLKTPLQNLLVEIGLISDREINSQTERRENKYGVRPDLGVFIGGLINGHIELKAPGKGANPRAFTSKHDKAQWKKLQSLPNLIYTDGQAWTLWRQNPDAADGATIQLKCVSQFTFDGDPTRYGAQTVTDDTASKFQTLIDHFLSWAPIPPESITELANYLAPLTRYLRDEVEVSLERVNSPLRLLAENWRSELMPGLNDTQFADAYAQTVVYAMTLATFEDPNAVRNNQAPRALRDVNPVLEEALRLFSHHTAAKELPASYPLLKRYLATLEPHRIKGDSNDLWLYFYETFLAKYDPKLRKNYGVYYTPVEVVELQVRLVDQILREKFGKPEGFASEGVTVLDPAVGTGTYPVAVARHALETVAGYGSGQIADTARMLANNIHGFEILVGPYTVAHLRLRETLTEPLRQDVIATAAAKGASMDEAGQLADQMRLNDRIKIFLANTLESPNQQPRGALTLNTQSLVAEHSAAQTLKREANILVCIGNPPYRRDEAIYDDETRRSNWIRYGDIIEGGARQDAMGEIIPFRSFTQPLIDAGKGQYLQTIFNDYVYFWRWALWKLTETGNSNGIVSFITASSYLGGPGFAGMREQMRKDFDSLWIIDLGGDNLGARKTPNVFQITVPVTIAIGQRSNKTKTEKCDVLYTKIDEPTRGAKLNALNSLNLSNIDWKKASDKAGDSFYPIGQGEYFGWPALTDMFPYHTAGAVFYRSWPIGETKELLESRWSTLTCASISERAKLFKESRDRKIGNSLSNAKLPGGQLPSIKESKLEDGIKPSRYGFRSFDRQYSIYDFRLGDYLRPTLNSLDGPHQLYIVSPDSLQPSLGQMAIVSHLLPDQHHFNGRGGKDIIPLYRDAAATDPNITDGLLDVLSGAYNQPVTAEDLAAYVYALLGGQSYTSRFWNELETPGPRVPITRDPVLFERAVAAGRNLIHLHTFGERFGRASGIPDGTVSQIGSVGSVMPENPDYDPDTQELRVGDAVWSPVSEAVWNYEVSGLKVVQSWLGYRMKVRSGRKSSPLDDIRPQQWDSATTRELLHLLRILETTLQQEPMLRSILDDVVDGDVFLASELPPPTDANRAAPKAQSDGVIGTLI